MLDDICSLAVLPLHGRHAVNQQWCLAWQLGQLAKRNVQTSCTAVKCLSRRRVWSVTGFASHGVVICTANFHSIAGYLCTVVTF